MYANRIDLTEDEILLLDGRSRAEVQSEVDRIKSFRAKVAGGMSIYMARIISDAETTGILDFKNSSGGKCARCGEPGSSDAVYLRGPNRGQRKKRNPTIYHTTSYVGSQSFCMGCWPTVMKELREMDHAPLYEIKIQGIVNKVILDLEMKCYGCELVYWKTETKAGWDCPSCGRSMRPFNGSGKRIIEIAALNAANILMR
jgi:hypothetical protein